jgi:hypothetical protein
MFILSTLGLLAFMTALAVASSVASSTVARALGARPFQLFDVERPTSSRMKEVAIRTAAALAPLAVIVGVFFVAMMIGGDSKATTRVTVLPGPAKEAGMQDGDRVVEIDQRTIKDWEELRAAFGTPHAAHLVVVERGGERVTLSVTANAVGRIGVESQHDSRPMGWTKAIALGVITPFEVIAGTFNSAFRTQDKADFQGPVGIVRATAQAGAKGVAASLWFLAMLGAYIWPAFPLAHVLDAASLPSFQRNYPVDRGGAPVTLETRRVARARQLFNALLVVCGSLLFAYGIVEGVGARVPKAMFLPQMLLPSIWLGPILFPLTWRLAKLLWGAATAVLCTAALIVPLLNLALLVFLSTRAHAHLREHLQSS